MVNDTHQGASIRRTMVNDTNQGASIRRTTVISDTLKEIILQLT